MIPLYGFRQGDTIGLLVLAEPQDTMITLCQKLGAAASVRVAPGARVYVEIDGERIDDRSTVARVELAPLDRFDVREEDPKP